LFIEAPEEGENAQLAACNVSFMSTCCHFYGLTPEKSLQQCGRKSHNKVQDNEGLIQLEVSEFKYIYISSSQKPQAQP